MVQSVSVQHPSSIPFLQPSTKHPTNVQWGCNQVRVEAGIGCGFAHVPRNLAQTSHDGQKHYRLDIGNCPGSTVLRMESNYGPECLGTTPQFHSFPGRPGPKHHHEEMLLKHGQSLLHLSD